MDWSFRWVVFVLLLNYNSNAIPVQQDFCLEYERENDGVGYCLNGGACVNGDFDKECKCLSGFKGTTCTEEIDECSTDESICLNGATCVNDWGSYKCLCLNGFEGRHCEINIDDCKPNSCPANKVCMDGRDTFTCECPPEKYGPDCDKDDLCVLDSPCVHGNCSMTESGNYFCECESGFEGRNCDKDINECDQYPCRQGRCENTPGGYKCHCDTGFTGVNCEDLVLHCAGNPCQNAGSCLNRYDGYTCMCMPGFTGPNCETRLDTSCKKDCQNGGVCYQRHKCYCPPAFDGDLCEIPKPSPCNHDYCGLNGFCSPTADYSDYYCNCLPGYQGEHCQVQECIKGDCNMFVDHCKLDNVTCSGHGHCISQTNGYKCKCFENFGGDNCEFVKYSTGDADSPTVLSGNVYLFVMGSEENVLGKLRDILQQIGRLIDVYIRVRLDVNGHPKIYYFDPEYGRGDLVDTSNMFDSSDKSIVHGLVRSGAQKLPALKSIKGRRYKGFMIVLRIDILPCLNAKSSKPSIYCPQEVDEVASELIKSSTNKVLAPLGVSIYRAEGGRDEDNSTRFVYIFLGGLILFGVVVLIGVLTIHTKKMAYRDRNFITALTWVPPKADMKSFQGSMSSFYPSQFETYHQNASTITSIGASSTNGSLVSTSCEQANKNYHDSSKLPPIHRIIKKADDHSVYAEVEQQLTAGADPNSTESMGRTPLMYAVNRHGDIALQLIELLTSYGADLKRTDRDGLTALHMAIESVSSFNERAALHLIQNYSDLDLNAAARREETPLKLCARVGDLSEMVVRALLKSGRVDVDSIGDEEYSESRRRTALHDATAVGSTKIMELLLRSGAKIDIKDANEQTSLHLAAENMRTDATKLLLTFGADRKLVDADNRNAEQIALGAFWQDGSRILNEQPIQQVDNNNGVDTSVKTAKRAKRVASMSVKAAKKSKTKAGANGAAEALLPTPSTMLSPSSDSCSPPTNGSNPVIAAQGMYSNHATYQVPPGSEFQYQQMQSSHQAYYQQQQQTPELMNNSVCSSDSQTVSPPIFASINNAPTPSYFNYNVNSMAGYPTNFYNINSGIYPALSRNEVNGEVSTSWYQPNNPADFYTSSKVPSYSNGTTLLEYSPNSDQSMHNYGSPELHPNMVSTAANASIPSCRDRTRRVY